MFILKEYFCPLPKDGHAGARKGNCRRGGVAFGCIDFGRGLVAEGLVGTLVVVEVHIAVYPVGRLLCPGVFAQVNVFSLEGSPDAHPGLPQHADGLAAGKLAG